MPFFPSSSRFAAYFVVFCAVSSTAAHAQGKDEQWEITSKMEMAGMPFAMPAQTNRVCIEKGNDAGLVPTKDNGDCKVTDQKRSGNKFTFSVACTGKDPMTGTGEMTYGTDSYDGRIRMKGKSGGESFDMTQTMSGRKIGSCTSTVRQDVAKAQAQAEAGLAQSCDIATKQFLWQSFEPGGPCAAQRSQFCATVTSAGTQAMEPVAYLKARKETMLADAMGKCGKDFGAVTAAACGRGVDTRNWEFVAAGYCDSDVRSIGAAQCKGRSFTATDAKMVPLCSRYVSLARADPDAAAAQARAAQPAQSAPPPADPVTDNLNKLKKLLPF